MGVACRNCLSGNVHGAQQSRTDEGTFPSAYCDEQRRCLSQQKGSER